MDKPEISQTKDGGFTYSLPISDLKGLAGVLRYFSDHAGIITGHMRNEEEWYNQAEYDFTVGEAERKATEAVEWLNRLEALCLPEKAEEIHEHLKKKYHDLPEGQLAEALRIIAGKY